MLDIFYKCFQSPFVFEKKQFFLRQQHLLTAAEDIVDFVVFATYPTLEVKHRLRAKG